MPYPLLARLLPLAGLALAGCGAEPIVTPWAHRYGDATDQQTLTLAIDPAGGDVALTGQFSGELDLGGGSVSGARQGDGDIFMGRLDAGGHHVWSGATGADGAQIGRGAAFDASGDTIFTGMFEGTVDLGAGPIEALPTDTFVAGFAPAGGGAAWVRHFSADDGGPAGVGISDPSAGLVIGGDGDLVLGGTFSGTLGFGGPPLDSAVGARTSFVAKLDPLGGFRWSAALGGDDNQAHAVASDAAGSVYLGGANEGIVSLGGGSFAATSQSGYVAAFTPAGTPAWLLQLGGAGTSDVWALVVDPAGDLVVLGTFTGGLQLGSQAALASAAQDSFAAKLSPAGELRWLTALPGMAVNAAATDADGNVLIGGSYVGEPAPGGRLFPFATVNAAFYAELSPDGALQRGRAFGSGTDASAVTGIAAAAGDVVLAGTFEGVLDITPKALRSAGGSDLFVARLHR
jgi:hypothetical protein